jgi:hypothetical protein
MRIEKYTTAEGWPAVRWLQEVPTGESWHGYLRSWQIALGIALGALLAVHLLSDGVDTRWSLFWGGVVGFAVIAPDAFNRIGSSLEGKGSGSLPKTDWERNWIARLKAKAIFRKEKCRAMLHHTREGGFILEVTRDWDIQAFPLQAFDRFELGTSQEWFGDVAARELAQLEHQPGSWVIVAAVQGRGVLRIAESGRDKAGISNLLLALSEAFVDNRKALLARVV